MKTTVQTKPQVINCPVIWRKEPYVRPVNNEQSAIMQRICYVHEGRQYYTDVVLELVKPENAITRYRAMRTRTFNAKRNGALGFYKMEVSA